MGSLPSFGITKVSGPKSISIVNRKMLTSNDQSAYGIGLGVVRLRAPFGALAKG